MEIQVKQTSKTEWIYDYGVCEIVITLQGDVGEYEILQQCKYAIKGLGFGGGVDLEDEKEIKEKTSKK